MSPSEVSTHRFPVCRFLPVDFGFSVVAICSDYVESNWKTKFPRSKTKTKAKSFTRRLRRSRIVESVRSDATSLEPGRVFRLEASKLVSPILDIDSRFLLSLRRRDSIPPARVSAKPIALPSYRFDFSLALT